MEEEVLNLLQFGFLFELRLDIVVYSYNIAIINVIRKTIVRQVVKNLLKFGVFVKLKVVIYFIVDKIQPILIIVAAFMTMPKEIVTTASEILIIVLFSAVLYDMTHKIVAFMQI